MLHLKTVLEPFGPACAIILTDDEVRQLSARATPPVVVTIGERSARLRVARMGGRNCIGLSKAARATLGVGIGDRVEATIALDETERTVTLPPELSAALEADPAAHAVFDALSYTRRREHAAAIGTAKRPETRTRRLEQILASLRDQ